MTNPVTGDVEILTRTGLFPAVDNSELVRLAGLLKRRTYRRGEVIYHSDDPPGGLFIVEQGTVKLQLPSAGGRVFTISWIPGGGFFGTISLFGEIVRSETAIALEACELRLLDRSTFRAFLHENPEAAEACLETLASRWRRTLSRLGDFMTLDILGRVARVLLELTPQFATAGPDGVSTIRLLTQVELASLVGASRESIAQALKTLSAQGIIQVVDGKIGVLQPAELQSLVR